MRLLCFGTCGIRRENGHYVLSIPWRNGRVNLPDNKFMAKHHLESLNKHLTKTRLTNIYVCILKKFLENGYTERVSENELKINDVTVWYIPQHLALSKPGKVRPIFDYSTQYHGTTHNNECMQGSYLTKNIGRFAAISAIYLRDNSRRWLNVIVQVHAPDVDCNALLLYDDDDSIVEYTMTSYLFGIWCAVSSASALRHNVTDINPNPLIRKSILKSFYVRHVEIGDSWNKTSAPKRWI